MAEQGFTLTSPAFAHNDTIPLVHTCDGENSQPVLGWMHAPSGTKSFALIMTDPDAPAGTFTHWVLFDIPANSARLAGSEAGVGGRNDFQHDHYGGPCPPPKHGQHRYFFRLYALDVESLGLPAGAKRAQVEAAMEGHILGTAELIGRYAHKTG